MRSCDGSARGGKAQILGYTYTATPDMTDFRILWPSVLYGVLPSMELTSPTHLLKHPRPNSSTT